MAERPILFSGPMVRAILARRKTQTRRVAKPTPKVFSQGTGHIAVLHEPCRYGKPGDRLWVRETWCPANSEEGPVVLYPADHGRRCLADESYPVDYAKYPLKGEAWSAWAPEVEAGTVKAYRPSIHMPRWACRLVLELIDASLERLQDISEQDAIAEGVDESAVESFRRAGVERPAGFAFRELWTSINGSESWEANPWVWVLHFRPSPISQKGMP